MSVVTVCWECGICKTLSRGSACFKCHRDKKGKPAGPDPIVLEQIQMSETMLDEIQYHSRIFDRILRGPLR